MVGGWSPTLLKAGTEHAPVLDHPGSKGGRVFIHQLPVMLLHFYFQVLRVEFRRQWHNQKLASAFFKVTFFQSTNLGRQVLVNIPHSNEQHVLP